MVIKMKPLKQLSFVLLSSAILFAACNNKKNNTTAMKEIKLKDVEVTGSRISEKQKEAPLTVESMDIIAIKQCPQNSFYE